MALVHKHRCRRHCGQCRPPSARYHPVAFSVQPGNISLETVFAPSLVKDPSKGSEIYECVVCGEDFTPSPSVIGCEEHIYCNTCAAEAFRQALHDFHQFPATCCLDKILAPRNFRHLICNDEYVEYMARLGEHMVPTVLKVYCAKQHCGKFIHPRFFTQDMYSSIAPCGDSLCGTKTCVGCKKNWKSRAHRCNMDDECAQLPQYTSDCRIKTCPTCNMRIELSDACNHMTCANCGHEFCFVRLLSWAELHAVSECPEYGDPTEGYDADGYERFSRGLHVRTGRNRNGQDRKGKILRADIENYEMALLPQVHEPIDWGNVRGWEDDEPLPLNNEDIERDGMGWATFTDDDESESHASEYSYVDRYPGPDIMEPPFPDDEELVRDPFARFPASEGGSERDILEPAFRMNDELGWGAREDPSIINWDARRDVMQPNSRDNDELEWNVSKRSTLSDWNTRAGARERKAMKWKESLWRNRLAGFVQMSCPHPDMSPSLFMPAGRHISGARRANLDPIY